MRVWAKVLKNQQILRRYMAITRDYPEKSPQAYFSSRLLVARSAMKVYPGKSIAPARQNRMLCRFSNTAAPNSPRHSIRFWPSQLSFLRWCCASEILLRKTQAWKSITVSVSKSVRVDKSARSPFTRGRVSWYRAPFRVSRPGKRSATRSNTGDCVRRLR